jgi:hypothetical protein
MRRKPRLRNPPWVDAALTKNWAKLEKLVGPKWMPVDTMQPRQSGAWQEGEKYWEYGSGHYGTVFPTHDPHVVLKITSDPSEAELVAFTVDAARREKHGMPEGLVRYHRIFQLPGSYRSRPIYIIWREAARVVGLASFTAMRVDQRTKREGQAYITRFWDAAARVRDFLKTRPVSLLEEYARLADESDLPDLYAMGDVKLNQLDAHRRYGTAYAALPTLAELIANTDGVYLIGKTFEYYLDHGVVLADVHLNNIGLVEREGYRDLVLVITDPGHAVFTRPAAFERPQMVANRRRGFRRKRRAS